MDKVRVRDILTSDSLFMCCICAFICSIYCVTDIDIGINSFNLYPM